jgi:hypothetical protein
VRPPWTVRSPAAAQRGAARTLGSGAARACRCWALATTQSVGHHCSGTNCFLFFRNCLPSLILVHDECLPMQRLCRVVFNFVMCFRHLAELGFL